MSNLATIENNQVGGGLAIRSMDDLNQLSEILFKSGYFADAKSVAQCAVKVLAGKEMGFGTFASMKGIHIVQGNPSVGYQLMAKAIKRHPNYDYRTIKLSPKECEIAFFERVNGEWVELGRESLTMTEAIERKLNQSWSKQDNQWKDKPTWKQHPKNMLFARCITNGQAFYCPDVFDMPVYLDDELEGDFPTPEALNGDAIATQAVEVVEHSQLSTITANQLKRLCTIGSNHGWDDDLEAYKELVESFGYKSRKSITVDKYEDICAWLERDPEEFRKAHNMAYTADIPGLDADEDDGAFEVQESLGELSYPHGYGTDD